MEPHVHQSESAAAERQMRREAEDRGVELLDALIELANACWRVPVKQHDRTPDEQANVEAFTSAVCESRELVYRMAPHTAATRLADTK